MKSFVILFGFMIFIPLLFTNSANACQYITSDDTIKEDFDTYDFIFSGKVLKVESPTDYTLITLEVIDQWKGQHHEKVLLFTCKGENDDGLQFKESESYLIFAEKLSSAYPVVKDFGPTKLLSDAKNDILFLDQKSNITRFHYDQPTESAPTKIRLDSPIRQLHFGITFDEIQCNDNLILIQKYDGTPACVKPKSAQTLYERGWTPTLKILVNRESPPVYLGSTDIPSASNQFALNFYSHVSEDKSNIFFSPTSIFTAFAIAYEGAKDNTADEMQHVFGFEPDKSKRTVQFADMQEQLNKKQQNNTISLANALWIKEGFDVLPEYIDTAKTYYESDIESINFSDKNSVDTINEWINEKTKGKIEKIFEDLDPSTEMVITNAIYFKGIWEEPFDQEKTTVRDFHVTSDTTVQVPMMESKTIFPNVAINDLVKIVELPYEGEKFSMLILLPGDEGMSSLEDSLSVDNLNKWKKELHATKTKVYMPKFKLETEYDLKQLLQDMGIHDAFGNADFTGISNSGLYIEKAAHKAFVEVNEEGTEAAAATGIAMYVSAPFEFIIDRPFVFIIQDNETGSILFMGRVVNPT